MESHRQGTQIPRYVSLRRMILEYVLMFGYNTIVSEKIAVVEDSMRFFYDFYGFSMEFANFIEFRNCYNF